MYTLKQAAEILGISIVTLRRYIKNGKITAKKVGKEYRVTAEDVEALKSASSPTDPAAIVESALGTNEDYRYEHQRADAFRQAEKILLERGDVALAETIGKDARVFSYRLIVKSRSEENKISNRGRFSPRMTGTDGEGNPAAWPDPADIDDVLVSHAKMRADSVSNPFTKAVYSDMVYEFSKNSDKPVYGRIAIESYIQAATERPEDLEQYRYFNTQDHILRAFEISLSLKDATLFAKAKTSAILIMQELIGKNQPRILLEIIREMLRHTKKLNQADVGAIETLIDDASKLYFKEDNQHLGRSFIELKKFLPNSNTSLLNQRLKEVQRELYDSFIREGEAKSTSGMVAAHFYSEALKIGRGVLTGTEESSLRRKIEDANLKSETEMKSHSFELKITNDDIRKYTDAVLRDSLEESLERIAALPGMIPSLTQAEKRANDLMDRFPISQMFATQSLQDGRVVSTTGGGHEITQDHILSQLNEAIRMHGLWLGFLFDELIKRGLDAPKLAGLLSQKDFFPNDAMPAISEGIANYFDGKYYSAIAVLIPQIEQLLRLANRKLGLPTLRSRDNGEQTVIYLGEALEALKDIFDNISPDAYSYLSMVLLDKRGPGLRDTAAHGLLDFNSGNKHQANLLLQIILMLALLEYSETTEESAQ